MNYVIIGNSAAAVGCIEGIRKNDKENKITVISEVPVPRVLSSATRAW